MAVVDVIKDGETTVVFHDDYCKDTTPEDVERGKRRIAEIVLPFIRAATGRDQRMRSG